MYKGAAESNFESRGVMAMPYVDKIRLRLATGMPEDNDVYDYQSSSANPGLDFIWGETDQPENALVSGGTPGERSLAIMPFVHKCQQKGIPVVAIHAGNAHLENMLVDHSVVCELISRKDLYYDVFRSLPVDDIAHILYETIEDASPNVSVLLSALLEVVLRLEGNVTIQNLAAFPLVKFLDKLNDLKTHGTVTQDEFDDLSRDYMSGSAEIETVRTFLGRLARQSDSLYGKVRGNTCNIKKMLNKSGIIGLDVGVSNNDLVIALAMNHFRYVQSLGRDFAIVIDGIAISRFLQLCDLFRERLHVISHSDFIASLAGGERNNDELFTEITGGIATIVLLNHKSGTSCQKWSDHLGKYHKIYVKTNVSQGDNLGTGFFGSGASRTNTQSINRDEEDVPRVRAETLSMLSDSLACIYSRNEILFSKL